MAEEIIDTYVIQYRIGDDWWNVQEFGEFLSTRTANRVLARYKDFTYVPLDNHGKIVIPEEFHVALKRTTTIYYELPKCLDNE